MKKLLLLALVMLGGVVNVSADDWYVVGDIAGGWTPTPVNDEKALSMTASSSISGIYYYDYTSTSTAAVYFAIANGDGTGDNNDAKWSNFNSTHRWANNCGGDSYDLDGSNDYEITTGHHDKNFKLTPSAASVTYRIVFDATNEKLSCVKLGDDWVVAGCYRPGKDSSKDEGSCYGTKWDNTLTSNRMTLQDNGVYVKQFSNVQFTETGEFWYRAVVRNSKDGAAYSSDIDTKYTYDIEIQHKVGGTPTVTITESPISDFYVIGGLGEAAWTVSATAMSKSSGVYSVAFSKPSASNYYRFALAPNTIIKDGVVFNYDRLVRPSCGKKADWVLNTFTNIVDYWVTTATDQGDAWQFPTSMSECDWAFSYNSNVLKWSVSPTFQRTITAANVATFSFAHDVAIPAGLTASYATGVDGNVLTTTAFVNGIPANTGALLEGSAGNYTFTPATSTDEVIGNKLVASVTSTDVTWDQDSKYNYILTTQTVNGDAAPKFYLVNKTSGNTVSAGRAWLQLDDPAPARGYFSLWGDDVTGIEKLTSAQSEGVVYDLQGRMVAQPTKGLYIVNGKKVVLK